MTVSYETIIGLEVHAQLQTRSKMFCCCSADYASAAPNTHVCPVCLGMPGVLPVINRQAIEFTAMTALALNCHIPGHTKFDRKNYPYPDLVKGYQISQYDAPIGLDGYLTFNINGTTRRADITRVHLEEDTARLTHRTAPDDERFSLVDVNRSGVPLMEIVGEPDLRSAEEARQYLIRLRTILRYLGVSTANMEEGSFRCDANISIRPEGGTESGSKVEIKNMNSFRSVFRALEYEARRQRRAVERGERLVQETRGWLEDAGKTVSQRSKEYAHDYRYFPEPDLPPLSFTDEWVSALKDRLPEMPEARQRRFMTAYLLPQYDASLLTASRAMADYFEACLKSGLPQGQPLAARARMIGNWLLGETSRIMNAEGITIEQFAEKVPPERLSGLLVLESQKTINTATAKSVLEEMFHTGKLAEEIIGQQGLSQISDTGDIEQAVREAIDANPQAVADFKGGKETALRFLVGQVMKITRGRANPHLVGDSLKRALEDS